MNLSSLLCSSNRFSFELKLGLKVIELERMLSTGRETEAELRQKLLQLETNIDQVAKDKSALEQKLNETVSWLKKC